MATLEGIQEKIAKLQAQAEALVATKSTVVLERIRGLMEKHGVTLADIEAHVGKRRGRKPGAAALAKKGSSVAKYRDPKTGATWSGHGRAPGWIANGKDRTKFLVAGGAAASPASAEKAPKAGNYPRGPQPALYRDPKSGVTWSGRGRAPAWLASAKARSKFLIAEAAAPASSAKANAEKAAPAKTAPKTTAKKTAVKKLAAKKVAAPARKAAQKDSAAAKSPAARKARVPKRTAKSEGSVDVAVTPAPTQVASEPASA
ncbi:H-NS family nucleoid-associated regulatory protein [Paraburkholderia sp. BR10937]|uniref:H-NS family nucleoid-associated regulatory protein n=1 Tax=Paraburkholderia sp. BR10937 TaxID=3236994 RepID=UPI0034D16FF1